MRAGVHFEKNARAFAKRKAPAPCFYVTQTKNKAIITRPHHKLCKQQK